MESSEAQRLLARETRTRPGPAPRTLGEEPLGERRWMLRGDEFLMRAMGEHYFHYRKGHGIVIERGPGADLSEEALWLSGSVYSGVACINGMMPIHASAVCHDGRVFAFTGPSGAGKSTLVAALAARGLPLFCDDTLVLDLSDPDTISCLPGHKRLKLTDAAFALTGITREEKVGAVVDKHYAQPPALHRGGPLPLGELLFLERGNTTEITPIEGADRLLRLKDDHYTALHFAAARQFDAARQFAHSARLARQIAMSRFVRPFDGESFAAGVALAAGHISDYGKGATEGPR